MYSIDGTPILVIYTSLNGLWSSCTLITLLDTIIKLSCVDSALLMPYPCRILQKYTTFGESDTHPLTFLKSPNNNH
ncbi:hypothetical protein H5410_015622 [Solanum commersonii]|uniref:Uncharacterized protein n=1 Tax=Solanum commersonii TaxID=4109 RepID=A0A9J5ZU73_SOLCO|nr:hypothetical protein H5410_015622 [Solanum commersonii]